MTTLKDLGLTEKEAVKILTTRRAKPAIIKKQFTDEEFSFGVVADTHLCSIHEKLNELHTFYAICEKTGIKQIVHAGDIVSGWGIYKGQENEVHTYGAEAQAGYVGKFYPHVDGITTYFITGNHCLSWWNRSGIDIGELIAQKREDLVYLGQYQADIELGGVKIRLMHPDGGGAYALSYKAQKIAEQIPSGEKPHILICGHWHTSHYFFYRLMHILNAGCFEGQSAFLLRKGINPAIGGWTVKVHLANDKKRSLVSITPTFVPFF